MYPKGSGATENVQPMSDFKMTIVWYLQSRSSQAKVLKWEKCWVEVEFDFYITFTICLPDFSLLQRRNHEAVGGDDGGWRERNEAAKLVRKWWEIMKWNNMWPGGIWPRLILYHPSSWNCRQIPIKLQLLQLHCNLLPNCKLCNPL